MTEEERIAVLRVKLRLSGMDPSWIETMVSFYSLDSMEGYVHYCDDKLNGECHDVYKIPPSNRRRTADD